MRGFCCVSTNRQRRSRQDYQSPSIDVAKRQRPFSSDSCLSLTASNPITRSTSISLLKALSVTSRKSSSLSLLDMPAEIIDNISSFLPVSDYVSFRCYVCRQFYARAIDYPNGSEIFNVAITKDAKFPRAPVIEALLGRKLFPIDPSMNNNAAIKWSCMTGEFEAVKVLLGHSLVDPSSESNLCIRLASACGSL